jgi:hypothetical protein
MLLRNRLPGGALFTGVLFGQSAEVVVPGRVGGRRHKGVRFEPYRGDLPAYNLAQIHQEDESVADLLIALVIKGFFNGKT